jgi:peptide deformylase
MIYPIVAYGDPVLRKRGADIEKNSIDLKELSEDMFETMHNASGIGLAAPQIGKSIRLFVVEIELDEEDGKEPVHFKKVFVNPEILEETGDEWAFEEGCLSIPGIHEEVSRKSNLRIRYMDENWEEHEEEYDGMLARVIQHEYDHIEGVLFTDYLSPLKKQLIKGKLNGISKGKAKVTYRMKFPKVK